MTITLFRRLLPLVFLLALPQTRARLVAQTAVSPAPTSASSDTGASTGADPSRRKARAAAELRIEEHQRILGVMPNFNTSNVKDAAPLSPRQKFDLAAKGAFDPFTFVAAGIDAGLSQAQNNFPEYRAGTVGYAKRFGASYADSFDGTMLSNALFPILLRQDPRYFRKATGSFTSRLWYALASTVKCKNDNGRWAPDYSNVLGNIAAGGLSNLYYPSSDRGVGLTFERAATVMAEGTVGAVVVEFWPDISRRFVAKHHATEVHP